MSKTVSLPFPKKEFIAISPVMLWIPMLLADSNCSLDHQGT